MLEKEALEQIKLLVEPEVVGKEGVGETASPSFLEVYNIACRGLGEGQSGAETTSVP